MGFEPMIRVLQTLALPLGDVAMLLLRKKIADCGLKTGDCLNNQQSSIFNQQPERAMGFEPTTFSLARRRTTTVLRPRVGL
jgi:hypothetical protein